MTKERVDLTGEIGLSILRLSIQKHIGWIIRDVRETDVGIDATAEQVIEGNPTAKYISIQLKTGFGNVLTSASGDFYFYFDDTHYRYWKSSSIPIIFVLCDPDSELLYWTQIVERSIEKTPKHYKLKISKVSMLNSDSIVPFEDIIDTYQSKSVIPMDFKEWSIEERVEYCSELMTNCADSLKAIRIEINKLDDIYKKGIGKAESFMANNSSGYSVSMSNKFLDGIARSYTLGINICKTRIQKEYPIAIQTHIEVVRLMEVLFLSCSGMRPDLDLLISALSEDKKQIENTILKGEEVVYFFQNKKTLENSELNRAERSFSMIVEDYMANLQSLSMLIDNAIIKGTC